MSWQTVPAVVFQTMAVRNVPKIPFVSTVTVKETTCILVSTVKLGKTGSSG